MIKGVNLGNWLVLEKWMSPGLFAGTSAEDESHLSAALDDTTKAQLYKQHRDTYITERDFAYLASKGISAVRIPVPFFVFGGYPPYVGCVEYLDRAMEWATAYDIKVFLELHTVPGSQNGFDNGGICGVCTWHKHPEDVAFAIDVLRRLTARYHQHRAFWAIGVLNEPVSEQLWVEMDIPRRYPGTDPILASESEPVPTEFLKQFYRDAYAAIRSESESVLVVFHDGFRLEEWGDYFEQQGFDRYVVDVHLYLMMLTFPQGDQSLQAYLDYAAGWRAGLERAAAKFPLMIGEWCLNTMSETTVPDEVTQRQEFYQRIASAQLETWEPAMAWFFWSYKVLAEGPNWDGWDFGKSTDTGLFPSGALP